MEQESALPMYDNYSCLDSKDALIYHSFTMPKILPLCVGNYIVEGDLDDPDIINQIEDPIQLVWINIQAKQRFMNRSAYDTLVLPVFFV